MDLGRFFKPKNGETSAVSSVNKPCAVPMLNQVMSATRGATDAFSEVGRHINSSLRKLGAKNVEVGTGFGVGFGHGFGVGPAVKPGVLQQIQSCLVVVMTKVMMKFGVAPNLPFGQGAFPTSLQSAIGMVNRLNTASHQSTMVGLRQMSTKPANQASQGLAGSQSMQISSASKGNAVDSTSSSQTDATAGRLRSENNILQMVLKHQQMIDELQEENEKLRKILVEDLKIPSSWLQARASDRNKLSCTYCFECLRKQGKK